MERITSTKNQAVQLMKALFTRKSRNEHGLFPVEGAVMIREALSNGLVPHLVLAEDKFEELAGQLEAAGARAHLASPNVLSAACDTVTPQGIVCAFTLPEELPEENLPEKLVILDGVQDPGNCGTIWRTADAAGIGGIVFGLKSADPLSAKVQRAAMGSGFRVGYRSCDLTELLPALRVKGYSIISSALDGEDFYARTPVGEKFALIIGSEAHGVSQTTKDASTHILKLPMRGGAESLNAAVAAGIMMYELMR